MGLELISYRCPLTSTQKSLALGLGTSDIARMPCCLLFFIDSEQFQEMFESNDESED